MGVGAGLYMYDVVVKKFAVSSPDEFLLSNVNSRTRSLYAVARPSVVCLSVTLVRRTQPVEIFGNIGHPLTSTENFTEIVLGNPSVRGLNARRVAKYSDFGPTEDDISETALDCFVSEISSKMPLLYIPLIFHPKFGDVLFRKDCLSNFVTFGWRKSVKWCIRCVLESESNIRLKTSFEPNNNRSETGKFNRKGPLVTVCERYRRCRTFSHQEVDRNNSFGTRSSSTHGQ